MKHFWITLLVIINVAVTATAQTTQSLIDSARHYRTSDYARCISFATAAYKQAVARQEVRQAGESAFLLGAGNYLAGRYDDALRFYFETEQNYLSRNDQEGLSELYAEMSVLYVRLKKFQEADDVSKKAITNAMWVKDTLRLATASNDRGLMFLDQHKNDSAISYFQYSYDLYKKVGSKIGMAYSLDYLASVMQEKGEFAAAIASLTESKQLRKGIGDKTGEAIAIENIGELYISEKKPGQAINYFNDAILKAHILKYTDLETYAYDNLAKASEQVGKYKEAYSALQSYITLNQALMHQKRVQAIEELQTRYETKQKEQQNKLLTEKNEIQAIKLSRNRIVIYALSVSALLGAGLFYLLYTRYKFRQQARLQQAIFEEQKLKAQGIMDAEENERQRLARELHDGVGQLLSAARRKIQLAVNTDSAAESHTDETLRLLDDSIKEVRDLSHSMMPPSLLNKGLRQAIEEFISRLNSGDAISITCEWVDTDGMELDKTVVLMLYRTLQEMISNAIRHARAKTIQIELVRHKHELSMMVYDDGIGFDKGKLLATGKGMGLKNIQSRIAYIGGSLHIDTMPGKGTTYIVELPL